MSRYLVDMETITLVQFGHATVIRNLTAHADTDIGATLMSAGLSTSRVRPA